MVKTVQDAYGEILRLRNEFYQKWQEVPQYDENRDAYKAKYEAFDKALELLTPSIMDPQKEDSNELTHSVTETSDQEESVSEDLLDEIHNRWEDDPHTKWPKCPYKDFKNIACHFASWQKKIDSRYANLGLVEQIRLQQKCYEKGMADMKQQMMKDAVECAVSVLWRQSQEMDEKLEKLSLNDRVKLIIIKED